jgi:YD repeat-containing protein
MQAWTRAVSLKARRTICGSALFLLILIAFLPREAAASGKASPLDWDPVLLDAPRPSPLPVGYGDGPSFYQSLVKLADGSLGLSFVDVYLPAGDEPLIIKRYYRSSLRTEGVFGTGWSSNLDVRLLTDGASARIVEDDGRVVRYEPDASGEFMPVTGTFPSSQLERSGRGWVRKWSTGLRETFDGAGRLTQRVTATSQLQFSYATDASRHPAMLVDGVGHRATLTYDDGQLAAVTYPGGRSIHYEYDQHQLIKAIDPIGRTTLFKYDDVGMTALVLVGGNQLEFDYAPGGNLRKVRGPGSLAATYNWTTSPDRPGVTMTTTVSGTTRSLEIAPAAVDTNLWGSPAKTLRLAMLLRSEAPGDEAASVYLLGDKLLLESGNTRATLSPDNRSAPEPVPEPVEEDVHSWRLNFTPAMASGGGADVTYDAAGRAVAIAIAKGQRESWKWDNADRITEWTDVTGSISRYSYDDLDRLVRIDTDGETMLQMSYNEMGLITLLRAGRRQIAYTYDAAGHLETVEDNNGRVTRFNNNARGEPVEVSVNGKLVARAEYDQDNRLSKFENAKGTKKYYLYDSNGNLVTVRGEDGKSTTYKYDADNRIIGIIYPDGARISVDFAPDGRRVVVRDADGSETTSVRDQLGRLRSVKLPNQPPVTLTYSSDGQLHRITAPDEVYQAFEYDAAGSLIAEKGVGGSIRYERDDQGRLKTYSSDTAEANFAYSETGELGITLRRDLSTETLKYDRDGRLIEHVDPFGAKWKFSFAPFGLEKSVGPGANTLIRSYDHDGRLTAIRSELDGNKSTQTYEYDSAGRVTRITYEDGTTEKFSFDSGGQLTSYVNRIGSVFRYGYDASNNLVDIRGPDGLGHFRYDEEDRLIESQDPVAGTYRRKYSDNGETVVITDPQGFRSQISFDANGQILSVVDALGGKIGREYNGAGQLAALIDPNGHSLTWKYDEQGHIVETATAGGIRTRYSYDEHGRLVQTILPDATTLDLQYDEYGRLFRLSSSDGAVWDYGYDKAGGLVQVPRPGGAIIYTHDALGRIIAYRGSTGSKIEITYDSAGRPKAIRSPDKGKLNFSYDEHSQLKEIRLNSGSIRNQYDAEGRLQRIIYPNGVSTEYRYAKGNRVSSISTGDSRGLIILREKYDYDLRGNTIAVSRTSSAPETSVSENTLAVLLGTTNFRYDALNRLTEASYPDGFTEQFTYDAAGNIVGYRSNPKEADGTRDWKTLSYAYDASQALTAGDAGAASDARGNLCIRNGTAWCDGRYDAFNRLIQWHDESFEYDGNGHLSEWHDGKGHGTRYDYLGDQLFAATSIEHASTRYFVPGVQPGLWAAMRTGLEEYFPIRSSNGSLLGLTGPDGKMTMTCAYRSFTVGSSWASGEEKPNCELAGGRQFGPGMLFGNRFLSAQGMRFMSPDPAGPDRDGNRYSYALDNPLRFVDLAGTAGGEVTPINAWPQYENPIENPIVDRLKQMAAGPPNSPATGVAQNVLDQINRKQLDIRTYEYAQVAKGDVTTRLTNTAGYTTADSTTAHVFVRPDPSRPVSSIDSLTRTAIHEAKHVEQNLTNQFGGAQSRKIHELEAYLTEWKVDPTLGQGRGALSRSDVVDYVAKNYADKPGSSVMREQTLVQGKGVWFEGDTTFADRVDKLKRLRMEQAIDRAQRIPPISSQPTFGTGTVGRSVAKEGLGSSINSTTRKIVDSALSKNSALHDRIGMAAKKAFSYLSKKLGGAGRVLKNLLHAGAPIFVAKEAIDMAVGMGQAVGEAAFDVYDAYRKKRDAILNPLDKLIRDIEALDSSDPRIKKKKMARRQELVSALEPQPAQIGQINHLNTAQVPAEGSNAPNPVSDPAAGEGNSQPQANTNATPASNEPAGSQQPEQPLGPTTPLGGKDNQPGPAGKPKPDNPEPQNPKPPEAEAKPPEPDQQPESENPSGAQSLTGKQVKEWDALCGGNMEAVVAGMTNSTLPPALVPTCLCFYFIKKHVPNLSNEAVVDPPAQRQACGAYIASLQEKAQVAEAQPEPQNQPKPEKEEAAPPPEEPPATPTPEPQQEEAAQGPAETPPPIEDGLPPPPVPDFMKPQLPQPEPEAAPPPKPTPPVAEPERPPSAEPEKPNLYDKKQKVFASEMTPKETTAPKPSGTSAGGGGLAGAYKWAAGWLGYVSGKI